MAHHLHRSALLFCVPLRTHPDTPRRAAAWHLSQADCGCNPECAQLMLPALVPALCWELLRFCSLQPHAHVDKLFPEAWPTLAPHTCVHVCVCMSCESLAAMYSHSTPVLSCPAPDAPPAKLARQMCYLCSSAPVPLFGAAGACCLYYFVLDSGCFIDTSSGGTTLEKLAFPPRPCLLRPGLLVAWSVRAAIRFAAP